MTAQHIHGHTATIESAAHVDLAHKRPFLLLSLMLGLGYAVTPWLPVPGIAVLLWKGSAIGSLALYALHHHHRGDYALTGLALIFAALAIMFTEADMFAGALTGVVAAIALSMLFLRYRRTLLSHSQIALALALSLIFPAIIWLISADALIAGFALIMGIMAALGWTSAFPRYRAGAGTLIVAVISSAIAASPALSASPERYAASWLALYFGHFLLSVGIVQSLRTRKLKKLRAR